jgi:hypothetical protein
MKLYAGKPQDDCAYFATVSARINATLPSTTSSRPTRCHHPRLRDTRRQSRSQSKRYGVSWQNGGWGE